MGIQFQNSRWVRNSFILAERDLSDEDIRFTDFTDALITVTDTSPGGSFCVNPLPQYTKFADIRVENPLIPTAGKGAYYTEALENTQQVVYMRFGVPQFNSLTQFFTGFYSSHASVLARTGRASAPVTYRLGYILGMAVTIFNIPLLLVSTAVRASRWFLESPRSKFYYFKSAMNLYWNAVTGMVNTYCVNRGIVPRFMDDNSNSAIGGGFSFNKEDLRTLSSMMPEVMNENGQIDVYRMVGKAHRRRRIFEKRLAEFYERNSRAAPQSVVNEFRSLMSAAVTEADGGVPFAEYLDAWINSPTTTPAGLVQSTEGVRIDDAAIEKLPIPGENDEDVSTFQEFISLVETELDHGTAFVGFRVNATGEVSESFSSTTAESGIANKINSMSSSSKATDFNIAGGNIGFGLGSVVEGVKNFISGTADAFGVSGLAVLGGAAFADIPQHWENSVASLPNTTYTVPLVSPYGNPVSQLISMYIPLFMLLAGGLPRSTGKQSYTSPFLCQLYDKGKQQTRLGIIDSISVRRGITNLPFNRDGQAMGIEVTFSVKDLSTILHMPIAQGFSLNIMEALFDEDTVFSDYMAVLASMNIEDQIYRLNRFKLNLTRFSTNWNSWTSMSHIASFLGNGTPLKYLEIFYKGINTTPSGS